MHETDTLSRRSLAGTVAVVALVLASVVTLALALTAPGAAAQSSGDDPAVQNVTTNRTDGNLTVSVRATNVTEVDVAGVPDGWSVATHDDDYGAYATQLDEDRVLWFWRVPVAVDVSVTFSLPADAGRPADLAVVPYDGTDRGQAVAVFPDAVTATPTRTHSPPVTPTATTTSTPTDAPAPGNDATPAPTPGSAATDTTDGSGPGLGVGSALAALALAVLAVWRRE
jgi:hypothetical protein